MTTLTIDVARPSGTVFQTELVAEQVCDSEKAVILSVRRE